MDIINHLKYSLWPAAKVRLTFWWWIIKYGGKKNIPKDLIFNKMTESMERMQKNLMEALRRMPADIGEDEKKELLDLIKTAGELKEEAKAIRKPK